MDIFLDNPQRAAYCVYMANEKCIIANSNGIETGVVITAQELKELATWLCQEVQHCDPKYQERKTKSSPNQVEKEWGAMQEANGGYCDYCKAFAGWMLSEFWVTKRS